MSDDDRHDLHFYITGIQDGLKAELEAAHGGAQGYLNAIEVYGGPPDDNAIHDFIAQQIPRFPAELVLFGDTVKKLDPATSPAGGEPRTFRVDCVFTVMCCDDNLRSEVSRQRGDAASPGVIKMFSDVGETLSGLQLARRDDATVAVVPGKQLPDGDVLLTEGPLTPTGERYLELPGLAVYATDFETYFHWTEPDRREAETAVTEIEIEFAGTGGARLPGQLPGVAVD
jgi:phage gp37-like protein